MYFMTAICNYACCMRRCSSYNVVRFIYILFLLYLYVTMHVACVGVLAIMLFTYYFCCTCSSEQSGWSPSGLETVSVTRVGDIVTVNCSSSHLTSFAVLVDVRGAQV